MSTIEAKVLCYGISIGFCYAGGLLKVMLQERRIVEEWVWRTLETPSRKKKGKDGNMHYTKPIREKDGRVLRVVINPFVNPQRIVTVFFDRRLRK